MEGVYVGQGLTTLYVQNEWNHDFKLSRKEQLIHTLTGGSGANDTWSNEKEENRTGVVDLDFSKVESDLLFEIDKDKVAVFQAEPDGLGGLKRKANGASVLAKGFKDTTGKWSNGVGNITGGKGNNSYVFKNGGSISGKLEGAAPGQAQGKRNILDYSDFGEAIKANLTDSNINFNKDLVTAVVTEAVPILPLQERWVMMRNIRQSCSHISKKLV